MTKKILGDFFFFKQYYYSLSDFFFGLPLPLLAFGVDLVPDFLNGPPLDILSSLYNLSVTACATGVSGY